MLLERKRRAYRDRNLLLRPEHPVVYPYEQTVNRLPFQQRNDYENQPVPPAPPPLTYMERRELRDYARAYTRNFLFRLIPHWIGWVPYTVCWAVHFTSFITSLNDLRLEDEALFDRVTRLCAVGRRRNRRLVHQLRARAVAISVGARLALAPNHTLVLTQPCASQISPRLLLEGALATPTRRSCLDTHTVTLYADRMDLLFLECGQQAYARPAALLLRPAVRIVQRGDGGHARQPGGGALNFGKCHALRLG